MGEKASRMEEMVDGYDDEENEEVVLAWVTKEQEELDEQEDESGYKYLDDIRVQCRRWRSR